MPVVDYYRGLNKVVEVSLGVVVFTQSSLHLTLISHQIDARDTKTAVYAKVKEAVNKALIDKGQ